MHVRGELDLITSPKLIDCIRHLLHNDLKYLVIDLAGVSFLNSRAALALAQAAQTSAARGINLCLVGVTNSAVRDPLLLAGLSEILTAYRTLGAALATLAPHHHSAD